MSRSFTHALHATAFTTLAVTFVITLTVQVEWPSAIVWPASVALLPMAVLLALVGRSRTAFYSTAYLLVGGSCVYWFTLTIAAQLPDDDMAVNTLRLLPAIALLLVGGSGVGVMAGFGWCTAGYVIGSASSFIALLQLDQTIRFEVVPAALYLFTVLLIVLVWFTSRNERRATLGLTRAIGEELAAQVRWKAESRSAALLHDTVLSHLTAVANTTGRIPDEIRDQMRVDLDRVLDESWLDEPVADAAAPGAERPRRQPGAFQAALRDAESTGLELDVSGDPSRVDRLDEAGQQQLALAVSQCLVNVLNHSGRRDAEIAVSGTDDEVLVMVIDTGRGFVEEAVPADRLGLRSSIRGRIEEIGGTVQVWSTIGLGTSVIIRIPLGGAQTVSSRHQRAEAGS